METKLRTKVEYGIDDETGLRVHKNIEPPKQYLLDKFIFRQNLISEIKSKGIAEPKFHIIISYYDKLLDRDFLIKNHRKLRHRMEECFNHRKKGNPKFSSYFFFCERHKSKLSSSEGNTYYFFSKIKTNNLVKNTIEQKWEWDKVDNEVLEGGFHTHFLKSDIPDAVMLGNHSKIRQLRKKALGMEFIPPDTSKSLLHYYKILLIDALCRELPLVGNSKASISIKLANSNYFYDYHYGWEGYVAYGTKTCYNADMMWEVIDNANSSLSSSPRIPIKKLTKKSITKEELL